MKFRAILGVLAVILISARVTAEELKYSRDDLGCTNVGREMACSGESGQKFCTDVRNLCGRKISLKIKWRWGKEETVSVWANCPTCSGKILTIECTTPHCFSLSSGGADRLFGKTEQRWIPLFVMSPFRTDLAGNMLNPDNVATGDIIIVKHERFLPDPSYDYISSKATDLDSHHYKIEEVVRNEQGQKFVRVSDYVGSPKSLSQQAVAQQPIMDGEGSRTQPNEGNRVWWERPVVQATGGYDSKENRSLINSYDIVVFGPSSVQGAANEIVSNCLSAGGTTAYGAFKATPSPEIGARIAAAWGAFKTSVVACFKWSAIKESAGDLFDIGYVRRGRWEDGLHLEFTADNPNTKMYRRLHGIIKERLPDPVNKLVSFYLATQEYPKVDIRYDPPPDVRAALSQLPDPKELREFMGYAEREAELGGKKLLDDVKTEALTKTQRLGTDAARKDNKLLHEPIRLVGKAAEEAGKIAPGLVQSLIPQIQGNRIILGPASAAISQSGGVGGTPSVTVQVPIIGGCKTGTTCDFIGCRLTCN